MGRYRLCLVAPGHHPLVSKETFATAAEAYAKKFEWYAGPLKNMQCFVNVEQEQANGEWVTVLC